MILYHEKWDLPIMITNEGPTVLVFKELLELYKFQKGLLEQIDTGEGYISIFDEDKPLRVDRQIEHVPDILTLSLNTRKRINYLHKRIITEVGKSDQVLKFEELKKDFIEWIKAVRKEIFIDYEFEEEMEVKDVLKLFKVEFKERDDTPAELLCRLVDILISMTNIKVIFISFAGYLLSEEDLNHFISHCKLNNVILVFIEKEKPEKIKTNNILTIVDDFVLK